MSNKAFLILLAVGISAVVVYLTVVKAFLPTFLLPFLLVLFPVYIFYMSR